MHGLATILLLAVAAVEQSTVPQIVCDTPSEVASGSAVRLQCTLAPELRAVALVLQQRPAGNEVFVPTPGLRMAPGRFVVSICPDSLIPGAMHFFFEARDSEDRVLATSGNLEQPHLLTVRAPGDEEPLRAALPTRTSRIRDDDPLAAAREEREAQRMQTTRSVQRQPGSFLVGFGAGFGYGYYPTSHLDFRRELRIQSNLGPAGIMLLTPEVGYQISQTIAVGVQLTWEHLSGSGIGDGQFGSPATKSITVLGRGSYHLGDGRVQVVASAFAGGGQGFRLVVPPLPLQGLLRNDSVRGGPVVLGPGLGLLFHLHPHAAVLAESRLLAGLPRAAALVDARLGAQFSF